MFTNNPILNTKVHSQLIYSLIFKFISMILVFLTTSLTFKYLGNTDYGIWVTIYSIISWVYLLDFGFSNVIKTKLPTLLQDRQKEVNVLISTIYIGIGAISLLILLFFLILNLFVSFADFLNIDIAFVNFNAILFLNLLQICIQYFIYSFGRSQSFLNVIISGSKRFCGCNQL